MVCVDSSIFITIHRQPGSRLTTRFKTLVDEGDVGICGQVWVEVVGGFRSESKRNFVRQRLVEFHWLETTRQAHELAAEWLATFRGLGAGDAIIAATAYLNASELWTTDRGFVPLRSAGLNLLEV